TVERHDNGYHVRLPWKEDTQDLPDNWAIAYNRLKSVLTKLKDEPSLLSQYHDTFKDQLSKGIIEEVNPKAPPDGDVVHYLAHQPVLTPHKDTTKLRVVFDGSAHFKNAPCLNDKLHQGPVILPSLIDMLARFRIGNIAIISDVEKAFLQVHLQAKDRDATRCLWIRDISAPLSEQNMVIYRFTRVTFGLKPSPFLLGATIHEHLSHAEDQEMADTIKNNVYVDNLLMTASTPDEALEHCEKARKLFAEINMNLREFRTNSSEVNDKLPKMILGKSITPKVLGILWNSDDDTMTISCRYPEKSRITKRTISEQVAAVYDPMGWITPLTLLPKLFLQQLWKHEYRWDEELSEDHQREWTYITAQVQGFTRNLPRRICDDSATTCLVAFSDASKNAMAACVYLVCEGSSALVIAKSKLPSIKDNPTIPKLEINALTMATRLVNTVFHAISSKVSISAIMIFSDSEIALSWLANPQPDQKAGVLVRNRTAEIRRIADDLKRTGPLVKFGYVKTDLNPADCATRGLTRDDLNEHLWWTGPDFLIKEQQAWPQCHELVAVKTHEDILPNLTPCVCAAAQVQQTEKEEPIDWTRHSSMSRAVSAFAYALRWLQRLTERVNPDLQSRLLERFPTLHTRYDDNFITVQERRDAMKILIRCHQSVHVANGINYSKDRLFPVTDHDGLIRCRGRLQQSDLSEAGKSPLLLGAKTPLAALVIREAYMPHHLATAHTMARVREEYWIPQLRRQVQKILRRCVPCQRMNNLPFRYPQLPDLPARRVTRSRPFQHVGIDYFGPLTIKAGESGTSKAYGIIITCTTTRLLHLETVSDMTTESLINALRRFFARRGVPETVTSDNAPYSLLGDQILHGSAEQVAQDTTLARTMAIKGILWKTITPYAPWQGAFYERLIKSVKHSLYKSLGKEIVSLERLHTLLVEIEGTLNTRPLTYQEELWEDQPVIRPIDFIQRDMVVTFPLEGLKDASEDPGYYPTEELLQLRTRKQAEYALRSSHELTERFWKIWREQYLGALREQHTRYLAGGRGSPQVPTVDTVVLIADPNLPRNTWKLGRITEVKSNHEGIVREVELVLPNRRVIRRPINLLVPLELDDTSHPEGQDIVDHTGEVPEQTVEVPEHTEELPQNDTPLLDVDTEPSNNVSERRYHLRNRPRPNYGQLNRGLIPTMLYLCCLANLCGTLSAQLVESPVRLDLAMASGSIQFTTKGILIETNQIDSYELCAEDFCVVRGNSPQKEMIHLPPEITLHVHTVHLKVSYQGKMKILDTQCPAIPFCDCVECWFCTANLFNPECNPRAVIITIAIILYGIVAILYTFCYVPVVVGLPIRVVFIIATTTLQIAGKLAYSCYRSMRKTVRQRADGRRSTTGFVPLILVILAVHLAQACQNVDVFEMRATTCVKSSDENETCTFDTTQMLKMNTFHRDACFRIQKQGTLLKEIRLEWIRLQLICDKQTDMFTRHTIQRVVDAKRCPRSGSCRGDKCADINTTAIIPELSQGNAFPGITYCVESCGGPGCGCFYISSGCLFYRIYATPVNNDTYEIFHCLRWSEEVVIRKTVAQPHQTVEEETVILQPTIPQEWEKCGNM
ncbi:integrase core domain protein, partial [Ancylostoma duodenale]